MMMEKGPLVDKEDEMQYFAWKVFGCERTGNPAAPTVTIEIPGPDGPVAVAGMFDTGADSTELQPSFIATLGISMNQCGAIKAHGVWCPTTIVEARLDGHVFDLPITFFDNKADNEDINLFGRLGILDTFRILHDPAQQRTGFEWIEGLPPSEAAAAYESDISAWLAQNPAGFVAGCQYQ